MSEMEEAKWEDLNKDCLVNIFGRLDLESLLLDVPLVCKSWNNATLNPQCWQSLVFPLSIPSRSSHEEQHRLYDDSSATAFIMSAVRHSNRSATDLELPSYCTEEALLHVADECPELRALVLPSDLLLDHITMICNLMSRWKNLEKLSLGSSFSMAEIIYEISIHCNNFVSLAVKRANIGEEEAMAMATQLPHMKFLDLRHSYIAKEHLVMILEGCKDLVHLDCRDCTGFDQYDEDISKLGSHITTFLSEGSRLCHFYDDDDDDGLYFERDYDFYDDDDYSYGYTLKKRDYCDCCVGCPDCDDAFRSDCCSD